jgi:hypothetical protein
MAANPFTRGTCPGRARPPHRGSFARGHAKHRGRKKGTPNAISARVRNAIARAAKRIARGTNLDHEHWQRIIDKNPLIIEALEHQGKFTLDGAPRFRSRKFNLHTFCKDLSAVAMRAIQTEQFVDQHLVESVTLLAVRDPTEFAKFLALSLPKQSYLAARPHDEVLAPREAVNPGEYRRPPIPEWRLGVDLTLNSWTPVPVDQALAPQDAYHEVCGSPLNPAPGWDWKYDHEVNRYRAIALRPKTPIPEWTLRRDTKTGSMIPVLVDPRLTPEQAYHKEYGSPLFPASGWKWEFDSRTQRAIPLIADEPSRQGARFVTPRSRRLYRWHPDQGHYSLVREDDDDGEQDQYELYEYDNEGVTFKRYEAPLKPRTPTKPNHHKIAPEPEPRRRFFVRLADGNYAFARADQHSRTDLFEYDAKTKQIVRVAKRMKWQEAK